MRLRRPDPFLAGLVLLAGAILLVIGPCADEQADGEVPAARQPSPAETRLFMAPPSTTTTSRTSTTVASRHVHRVTSPAIGDLGVFRVTCYGPPVFPAGQTTATGAPVGPGSFAVDPRVIPLGTHLEVEGYGRGVANDVGGAVHGRHVDVWRSDPYHGCPIRSARVRVISS